MNKYFCKDFDIKNIEKFKEILSHCVVDFFDEDSFNNEKEPNLPFKYGIEITNDLVISGDGCFSGYLSDNIIKKMAYLEEIRDDDDVDYLEKEDLEIEIFNATEKAYDVFCEKVREILVDDEKIIFYSVYGEDYRMLNGDVTIITKDKYVVVSLTDIVEYHLDYFLQK